MYLLAPLPLAQSLGRSMRLRSLWSLRAAPASLSALRFALPRGGRSRGSVSFCNKPLCSLFRLRASPASLLWLALAPKLPTLCTSRPCSSISRRASSAGNFPSLLLSRGARLRPRAWLCLCPRLCRPLSCLVSGVKGLRLAGLVGSPRGWGARAYSPQIKQKRPKVRRLLWQSHYSSAPILPFCKGGASFASILLQVLRHCSPVRLAEHLRL